MKIALPPWGQVTDLSDEDAPTHGPDACAGEFCCIHNPSDHHMKDWDKCLRLDRRFPLVERVCKHGVGHPDPDSVKWIADVSDQDTADAEAVHGCDGCCHVA